MLVTLYEPWAYIWSFAVSFLKKNQLQHTTHQDNYFKLTFFCEINQPLSILLVNQQNSNFVTWIWWNLMQINCITITDVTGVEKYRVMDCVPLTISYNLYFLRILKSWNMLHHGSVGRVPSKECINIFGILLLFFIKKLCSYHFHFFFWWSIKFTQ